MKFELSGRKSHRSARSFGHAEDEGSALLHKTLLVLRFQNFD